MKFAVCFLGFFFCICETIVIKMDDNPKPGDSKNEMHMKVLLISLDGLRWDFISTHKLLFKNIISLQRRGVTVSHVENVFPTNTFPNHYSTVTGLYPESHGIIDNQMYDEKTGEKFSMSTTEGKWWNQAEPIWVTNQRQGHKSGVSNWPGFNVKIKGVLPSYTDKGNSRKKDSTKGIIPSNGKIDIALNWLHQPGVTFAGIYLEEPDTIQHDKGDETEQPEVKATAQLLDSVFGHLESQLETLGLQNQVNVIVIGDHGYVGINEKRIIQLSNYIDVKKYVKKTTGMTFISVFPKPGQLSTIYKRLHNAHPKMKVYLKSGLPNYMHIKNNKRTAPLLLLADPGWLINTGFENHINFKLDYFNRGEHGYSNLAKDMHPDFFAFGPCFKTGATFDKIRTIDIYPLMCSILNIKPRPNNGSLDNVTKLLSKTFLKTLIG